MSVTRQRRRRWAKTDLREGPFARYERGIIEGITDFEDPRQEWRRLFSELLGTFILVLVAAGGGMMGRRSRTRSAAPPPSSRPR